jgi:hypothetical protein
MESTRVNLVFHRIEFDGLVCHADALYQQKIVKVISLKHQNYCDGTLAELSDKIQPD